jgi:hypothetical protein
MRNFQIVLLLILVYSCQASKKHENKKSSDTFFKVILRDSRVGSYYLSIPLCDSSEFLIIPNNDFYQFISKRDKISREEYKSKFNLLLESNSCFKISEDERLYFNKMIISSADIAKYKLSMSDSLNSIFHENGVQKKQINDEFIKLVIHERYNSKCLIHINDMSGRLIYKVWSNENEEPK